MAVELGSAVGRIEIDASGVAKGVAEARAGLAGAQASLRAAGDAMAQAGRGLLTLGAPLSALGGLAAKAAGDFEAQMNVLGVAARDAGVGLDALRGVALRAGSDVTLVGVSASDVAQAMTGFVKAGLGVNDMLGDLQGYLAGTAPLGGALRAAIDLAAASELDLAQATDLVTITMSTFGLGADEVVAKVGNYVQAADASVASVTDLAEAMRNVGPTMAAFGFSLEDTNTALAILSTRGIAGAEAGTALKSMFVNVMRDAPEARQALADLNVQLYDQAGRMRSMPAIIGDLARALQGLTDEQRNQYVQSLAGSYGMKAMNTLLAEGADGWRRMEAAIGQAATMQMSAAAQTRGFNAALENLRSSVEGFLIAVGTPLINEVLTPLVRLLTDLVSGLTSVNPEVLKWGILVGGATTALGGLAVAVGQVIGALGTIKAALAVLAPLLAGLGLPILAVGAALGLLAAAWANDWGGIRERAAEAWAALQPMLAQLREWLATHLPPALQTLAGLWQTVLLPALQAVWAFVQGSVLPLLGQLWEWLVMYLPPALQALTELWQAVLLPALQAVWTFVATKLAPLFEALAGVTLAAMRLELRALAGLWQNVLLPALQAVWKFLAENVLPIFEQVIQAVRERLGPALMWLRDSVVAPLAGAFDAVGRAIDAVIGWLGRLKERIEGVQLPPWLTPGSPTPFEVGLWGVVDALRAASAASAPLLMGAMPAPAMAPSGPMATTNHYSFNVTVQAGQGARADEVAWAAELGVRRAARRIGVL